MLVALSGGALLSTATTIGITPFLRIIAHDLNTDLAAALGFVHTLVNATGRPALLTVLSEVSSAGRGAGLGLNITFSSLGWLRAPVVGGVVLGTAGFGGLAMLGFTFGLLGGALALTAWLLPRERARLRVARSER